MLPLVVEQCKIRSHVAGLQRSVRDFDVLLRANRARDQAAGQRRRNDHRLEMHGTHVCLLGYRSQYTPRNQVT